MGGSGALLKIKNLSDGKTVDEEVHLRQYLYDTSDKFSVTNNYAEYTEMIIGLREVVKRLKRCGDFIWRFTIGYQANDG